MLIPDPAHVHWGHYPFGPVLGSAVESQCWDTPIKLDSQRLKSYVAMLFHLATNNFLELTHCARALLTSLPAIAQQKDGVIQPQAASIHTVLPNFWTILAELWQNNYNSDVAGEHDLKFWFVTRAKTPNGQTGAVHSRMLQMCHVVHPAASHKLVFVHSWSQK